MGSIPFPNLADQPQYHPADPLQEYQRVAEIKGQQQQQAAQQQEMQMRQQQITDQTATTQAMLHDWDGKNPDALPMLILRRGGSANAVFNVQKQITERKTQLAQLDKDTLANQAAHNDAALGALQAASQVPDEQLGNHLVGAAKDLLDKGHIDQHHYDMVQQIAALPPDQARAHLSLFDKGLMGEKEQFSQAQAAQETKIKEQEAAAKDWKEAGQGMLYNTKTGQIVHGMAGVDQQEMQDWLGKNKGKGPADFLLWKNQHSPSMILQGGGGSATGDPMVDMVGQGRVDLATATQRMAPVAKNAFMSALNQKYPGYSQATFGVEKKVQEEFTSGDAAKNLTAFNTAIEHAGQLNSAIDALHNGKVVPWNQLANTFNTKLEGNDPVTNFNVIKSALSGEISKVFKGGQATDAEIKDVQGPFDAANSPQQLRGAIKNAITLMNSKRDNLKRQYEAGRQGKPNFGEGNQQQQSDFFSTFGGKKRE